MELPASQPDAPAPVSPEDHLRLERAAEYKHEYYAGKIQGMAGAPLASGSCAGCISDQRV